MTQINNYKDIQNKVISAWKYQFGPWSGGPDSAEIRHHPYTCKNRKDHPDLLVIREFWFQQFEDGFVYVMNIHRNFEEKLK